eukprot:scaffold1924_cov197-Alexandrium_tamarense.AAC.3
MLLVQLLEDTMKNYNSINIHYEEEEDLCNTLPSPSKTDGLSRASISIANEHTNPNPQDRLTPPFESSSEDGGRPSTLLSGTFNLIATIVGGPTRWGIQLRRNSTKCLWGESGGGDIWTPLVTEAVKATTSIDQHVDEVNGDYVLMGIIGIMLPFLIQRSLHALRWNCYIGFASVSILTLALCRGGLQRLYDNIIADDDDTNQQDDFTIHFFKVPSVEEILFSFPIVTCSFLCHFNIIAIQNALSVPTRQRMQTLIGYAVGSCFLLMYSLGLGGYLFAGESIQGNVLLNVPMSKGDGEDEGEFWLFLFGRIGTGVAIMLAMPLMALPCREALLEVVDVWFHDSHHRRGDVDNGGADADETSWCWRLFHRCNKDETTQDRSIATEDEIQEILPTASEDELVDGEDSILKPRASLLIRNEPIQKDYIFRNSFVHYGSTILIIAMCYSGAVIVRGVAFVWSFIGSSMAFFIAFIVPCGCFIVIESEVPSVDNGGDRHVSWICVAWAILVFSVVGAVVCTCNSLTS